MRPSGGVLYYALGGGLGHVTRAVAIGRHFFGLTGRPFAILTNCDHVPAAYREEPVVFVQSGEQRSPADLSARVAQVAAELRPAVLAVDAFPAGILGELPPLLETLACRKVAVLRRLREAWWDRWRLAAVLPRYDAAVVVEASAAPPDIPTRDVPAVLVRDATELASFAAARRALGCGPGATVVCLVRPAPLDPERSEALEALVRRLVAAADPGAVVLATSATRAEMFPLLERLPGIDLLIGPAGYNLVHEARATGTPAIWLPQPRRYDDQHGRVRDEPSASSPEGLAGWIDRLLTPSAATRAAPAYRNGAAEVARMLADF